MEKKNKAVIVIPLYKTDLDQDELISLNRTITVLKDHKFAVVCPETLDLTPLTPVLDKVDYATERFPDEYFSGLSGYNNLMLSNMFYNRFSVFEYILICQTDVYVFKDDLLKWCAKQYDYIGAPWIVSRQTFLNKALFDFNNLFRKVKKDRNNFFKVGNGGFSLRKTDMMLRIVNEQEENIKEAQRKKELHRHVEDVYFSLVAPLFIPEMKIPDYTEAVDFCIDRKPKESLKINNGRVPFACHGFNKPKVRDFWKPFIEKFNG